MAKTGHTKQEKGKEVILWLKQKKYQLKEERGSWNGEHAPAATCRRASFGFRNPFNHRKHSSNSCFKFGWAHHCCCCCTTHVLENVNVLSLGLMLLSYLCYCTTRVLIRVLNQIISWIMKIYVVVGMFMLLYVAYSILSVDIFMLVYHISWYHIRRRTNIMS